MSKTPGIYFYEWRKHRSLTQEQVAEKLDSSKGYYSDLERGKRRYNQETLEGLAGVYKCKPQDLLSVDPSKMTSEPINMWDEKLRRETSGLSDDALQDVIDFARFIKSKGSS